ncbi:aryl-alcohol oxidase precursor [Pleurotus eryngii]|uniref:Aryl-alcohol oxidase n=1 Tax=Pleurotus eryngii TaxID=5323 RepID=A0A9P6A967_PLEER|nr:aryl-alcohol oxidase precursor [Pleurotus eryngii]
MSFGTLRQLLLIACLALPSLAATNLPTADFDYVVVGAGNAGNVVAARLTEDPDVSVLVLEAGVSDENVLGAEAPLLAPGLVPNSIFDWNYTTTAQAGYNGRSIAYPRGRMLGGSSSVHYMVMMRGSIEDFDRYAAVTGDEGWNWDNIQQFVRKNEMVVPPADNHNTSGEFIPAVHGTNGSVSISLPGFPTPLDDRVLATTQEQSEEFFFNPDMGTGHPLGISWSIASVGNGQRSSSSTAYLRPAQSRPNLSVLINAQVTKLVNSGTTNGLPAFRCVEYAEQEGAPTTTVCAKKEVVLSAGSVGTPILLQLSGIGDENDLSSVGIDTIVNNPSVGRNLSDHLLLPAAFFVNSNQTFDNIFRNSSEFNADLDQWTNTRTGPLTALIANHLAWLRLPSNSSIFQTFPDPAAGPNSAHWETIFSNQWFHPAIPRPDTGSFMSVTNALISPVARGDIKLATSNPFDKPLINPQYLSTEFDIFTMIQAVKSNLRFLSGQAWADFVIRPFDPRLRDPTDDAAIESYIRDNANTIFHPVGTASMSPRGASWGVVDPDLKVKGVDGLRIVDGSILPFAPNAHTQGPIYLVGERGADLIKADQ